MVSVVEVQVRALRAHTLVEGTNHETLMGAIARAEAAKLKAFMAQIELQELRDKMKKMTSFPEKKRLLYKIKILKPYFILNHFFAKIIL